MRSVRNVLRAVTYVKGAAYEACVFLFRLCFTTAPPSFPATSRRLRAGPALS